MLTPKQIGAQAAAEGDRAVRQNDQERAVWEVWLAQQWASEALARELARKVKKQARLVALIADLTALLLITASAAIVVGAIVLVVAAFG